MSQNQRNETTTALPKQQRNDMEVLGEDNYLPWSEKMEALLEAKGLYHHVLYDEEEIGRMGRLEDCRKKNQQATTVAVISPFFTSPITSHPTPKSELITSHIKINNLNLNKKTESFMEIPETQINKFFFLGANEENSSNYAIKCDSVIGSSGECITPCINFNKVKVPKPFAWTQSVLMGKGNFMPRFQKGVKAIIQSLGVETGEWEEEQLTEVTDSILNLIINPLSKLSELYEDVEVFAKEVKYLSSTSTETQSTTTTTQSNIVPETETSDPEVSDETGTESQTSVSYTKTKPL